LFASVAHERIVATSSQAILDCFARKSLIEWATKFCIGRTSVRLGLLLVVMFALQQKGTP